MNRVLEKNNGKRIDQGIIVGGNLVVVSHPTEFRVVIKGIYLLGTKSIQNIRTSAVKDVDFEVLQETDHIVTCVETMNTKYMVQLNDTPENREVLKHF